VPEKRKRREDLAIFPPLSLSLPPLPRTGGEGSRKAPSPPTPSLGYVCQDKNSCSVKAEAV